MDYYGPINWVGSRDEKTAMLKNNFYYRPGTIIFVTSKGVANL